MNNSPPNGAKDVKKFYAENIPTKLKDFDVRKLDGKWYKVRGYNPKYDCYPCQTNTFKYNPTTNKMETEVKLRVANLGKTFYSSALLYWHVLAMHLLRVFWQKSLVAGRGCDEDKRVKF